VNYVASLLSGYSEPTAELLAEHPEAAPGPGLYHNPYFPNLNLAMAPPLTTTGQVTYDDGTEATVEQMSTDVAAFLAWTAEPTMVQRKQTGWPVLIFLLFATVLAYLSKQQIWAAAKPKKD
jgi:ubiquinol-cytochrome c reductase cytochrome c1 subunit